MPSEYKNHALPQPRKEAFNRKRKKLLCGKLDEGLSKRYGQIRGR